MKLKMKNNLILNGKDNIYIINLDLCTSIDILNDLKEVNIYYNSRHINLGGDVFDKVKNFLVKRFEIQEEKNENNN